MSHKKIIKKAINELKRIDIHRVKHGYSVKLPTRTIHVKNYEKADEIADKYTKKVLYKYARRA